MLIVVFSIWHVCYFSFSPWSFNLWVWFWVAGWLFVKIVIVLFIRPWDINFIALVWFWNFFWIFVCRTFCSPIWACQPLFWQLFLFFRFTRFKIENYLFIFLSFTSTVHIITLIVDVILKHFNVFLTIVIIFVVAHDDVIVLYIIIIIIVIFIIIVITIICIMKLIFFVP